MISLVDLTWSPVESTSLFLHTVGSIHLQFWSIVFLVQSCIWAGFVHLGWEIAYVDGTYLSTSSFSSIIMNTSAAVIVHLKKAGLNISHAPAAGTIYPHFLLFPPLLSKGTGLGSVQLDDSAYPVLPLSGALSPSAPLLPVSGTQGVSAVPSMDRFWAAWLCVTC